MEKPRGFVHVDYDTTEVSALVIGRLRLPLGVIGFVYGMSIVVAVAFGVYANITQGFVQANCLSSAMPGALCSFPRWDAFWVVAILVGAGLLIPIVSGLVGLGKWVGQQFKLAYTPKETYRSRNW